MRIQDSCAERGISRKLIFLSVTIVVAIVLRPDDARSVVAVDAAASPLDDSSSASSSFSLKEAWRLPLSIDPITNPETGVKYTPSTIAGGGGVDGTLVVADGDGVVFGVDATLEGTVLWSYLGPASSSSPRQQHTLKKILTPDPTFRKEVDPFNNQSQYDKVLLHYDGGLFASLDARTGKELWVHQEEGNITFSKAELLNNSLLVYMEKNGAHGNLVSFDATSGVVKYNTTIPSKYVPYNFWMSSTDSVVVLGFYIPGILLTYDAQTGAEACSFDSQNRSILTPPGQFAGKYGYLHVEGDDQIYNLLSCRLVSPAVITGFYTEVVTLGSDWYFFHTNLSMAYRQGLAKWAVALVDLEATEEKGAAIIVHGARIAKSSAPTIGSSSGLVVRWNLSLPLYDTLPISPVYASNHPFNPDVVILAANDRLNCYTKTSTSGGRRRSRSQEDRDERTGEGDGEGGIPVWNIPEVIPQAVYGPFTNVVYPLLLKEGGVEVDEMIFFPNLQGYVVYNTSSTGSKGGGQVVSRNEHLPLAGSVPFQCRSAAGGEEENGVEDGKGMNNKRLVAYVEVETGDLVAIYASGQK